MNLAPVAVPITLAIAIAFAKRTKHESIAGAEVFFFPKVFAYLVGTSGLILPIVPWLPRRAKLAETQGDLLVGAIGLAAIAAALFVFAAYCYRYRAVIRGDTLTVGAFWRREYRLADIVKTDLKKGRLSADFFVYLRSSKRLRFSGLLTDFEVFVDLLDLPTNDNELPPRHYYD